MELAKNGSSRCLIADGSGRKGQSSAGAAVFGERVLVVLASEQLVECEGGGGCPRCDRVGCGGCGCKIQGSHSPSAGEDGAHPVLRRMAAAGKPFTGCWQVPVPVGGGRPSASEWKRLEIELLARQGDSLNPLRLNL